jgi:hypothetical protein
MTVYVASAATFHDHHLVANGASKVIGQPSALTRVPLSE